MRGTVITERVRAPRHTARSVAPWHRSARSRVSVETWEDLKSDVGCVTEPDSWASSSCYTWLVTPEIVLLLCCYVTTCCRWVSWVSPELITHCPQLRPAPQSCLKSCWSGWSWKSSADIHGFQMVHVNHFCAPMTQTQATGGWYLCLKMKCLNECWLDDPPSVRMTLNDPIKRHPLSSSGQMLTYSLIFSFCWNITHIFKLAGSVTWKYLQYWYFPPIQPHK